jgi:membrane-associated phospholipid phosphatase
MDESAPVSASPSLPRPYWALALSGLFHPLLIPTYMYVLLLIINPFLFGSNDFGDERSMLTLIMMVLYTFVIPVISVLLMLMLNMVSSVMMEDRMERIGPLLLVMVLYFWIYYNLSQNNDVPTIFSAFLLGVVIALAVSFVVNVMDKISLHAVGMGGLTGMVMISMALFGTQGIGLGGITMSLGLLVLIVVLLAGLVGTARLALGAHTHVQIYAGYIVGFLAQWVALKLYF